MQHCRTNSKGHAECLGQRFNQGQALGCSPEAIGIQHICQERFVALAIMSVAQLRCTSVARSRHLLEIRRLAMYGLV